MKLTKKQQELVELIKNKQQELNEKLYVKHCGYFGVCLVKLIENNTRCEIIESKINSKMIYALLDKEVLTEEQVNDDIKLVTLKCA
jgi:hypothetical protein